MLKYLKNVVLLGKNGRLNGGRGLNFVTKKVKIFDFSCMLLTDFNVMALLKYIAQL